MNPFHSPKDNKGDVEDKATVCTVAQASLHWYLKASGMYDVVIISDCSMAIILTVATSSHALFGMRLELALGDDEDNDGGWLLLESVCE